MSDTTNSWIKWVFGVIFVLALIALVAAVMVMATRKGNQATSQAESDLENMSETRYTMYDATTVTGTQVMDVITRFKNDKICVYVNTAGTPESSLSSLTSITGGVSFIYEDPGTGVLTTAVTDATEKQREHEAKDPTKTNYINPSSNFYGLVTRSDTTGTITKVSFIRVKKS